MDLLHSLVQQSRYLPSSIFPSDWICPLVATLRNTAKTHSPCLAPLWGRFYVWLLEVRGANCSYARLPNASAVHDWKVGYRFGEAQHPGPMSDKFFRCAVVNPTALHGKTPELLSLQADLICASETSAVPSVQRTVAAEMRQHGYKSFFGEPVASLLADAEPNSALRGQAGGVAVFARSPSRPPLTAMPCQLQHTTRIVECFSRIGAMEVRVLCVYGVPSCHVSAFDTNNFLLQAAWNQVAQSKVPALVAGDWNCDVLSLPAWSNFAMHGFVEAFQAVQSRLDRQLPPTCKGSTKFDTAILSPHLVSLLVDACVLDQDHIFDTHAPLLLDFGVPVQLPVACRWALPKTWNDFDFQTETMAVEYDCQVAKVADAIQGVVTRQDLEKAFQFWAEKVEDSVAAAIRHHDPNALGLPRSHRGRCRGVRTVNRQCVQLPRRGRAGDFQPDCEGTSIRVKWRVRQCRRVRTFQGGLRKFLSLEEPCERLLQQLLNEWRAIRGARGYGHSFSAWLLGWSFIEVVPVDFPSLQWIDEVRQLLEFDCKALSAHEVYQRKALQKFRLQEDVASGYSRQGFQVLRGPSRPPFSAVTTRVAQHASEVQPLEDAKFRLVVPRPLQFRSGVQVSLNDVVCQVLEVTPCGVTVELPQGHPGPQVSLNQDLLDCTAEELHAGFFQYWSQWWNRDTSAEATDPTCWKAFQQILDRHPAPWPELQVDMLDVGVWRKVLAKSSSRSATGACGFAVYELKQLSDPALLQFAMLCDKAVAVGMPSFMLQGRVNVLAKVDSPAGYGDGRPICVLPATYRLWTSVLCTQLLSAWAPLMPEGVVGGLPGRAARDITYCLQHAVECSALEDSPLSGFVMDIIKCYNGLPRPPLKLLLEKLGCPSELAGCWLEGLSRLTRAVSFCGCISAAQGSSTGAPEGDAMSVAATVSLCWLLHQVLAEFDVKASLFVDNWAWTTDLHDAHEVALRETLSLCKSLRLEVDWHKSFSWSRDKAGKEWWETYGPSILPAGAPFHYLHNAKDLGTMMHYRGPRVLGSFLVRLEEGHARLRRLGSQPRPLVNKAHLVQTSVWPAVFYGTEGRAVSVKHVAGLRSAAAKTLVGGHHHVNPHLALTCLSATLLDPEPYQLVAMLRTLRRTLLKYPAVGRSILKLTCQASGSPYQACGPAAALKAVLVRNEWEMSPEGLLRGPGNLRLCITNCAARDIRAVIEAAWAHQVRKAVSHRNGLGHVDVPDVHTTACLLKRFSVPEQRTLARHITGGFQTGATKRLWQGQEAGACRWCGQLETRHHRFLHCPMFQSIRDAHHEAVHALSELRPHWVYCPFATLPDEVDITTLVFMSRQPPAPPSLAAQALKDAGFSRLSLFTDGTCAHPQIPQARHAAWSVVLDAADTPALREEAVRFWKETGQGPPCFQTWACGLVPGVQSINRAELVAAIQAVSLGFCAGCLPTHIHTDSSYVFRILSTFALGAAESLMDSSSNVDLLRQLRDVWFQGVSVQKVRSHVQPAPGATQDMIWLFLGNAAADRACEHARRNDLSVVVEMVDSIASARSAQLEQLHLVYKYLLDLHFATNRVINQTKDSSSLGREDLPDPPDPSEVVVFSEVALQQWVQYRRLPMQAQPLDEPSPAGYIYSTWGPTFAWQLWKWAQTLVWTDEVVDAGGGVTTLELFCNFVVHSAALPPLVFQGPQKRRICLDFDSPEARLHPRTLRSWLQALTSALRQLERATSTYLLKGSASRKITSLSCLGDTQARSGFLGRCYFSLPEQTSVLLQEAIVHRTTGPFWRFVHGAADRRWQAPDALLMEAAALTDWQKLARRPKRTRR